MPTVTIEGQVPTVYLPRGGRRTVELTVRVQRLIERGYVTVVDEHVAGSGPVTTDPTLFDPAPLARPAPVLPVRSAPKSAWRDYLDAVGVAHTDEMTRADLMALAWRTAGYEPPMVGGSEDSPDV